MKTWTNPTVEELEVKMTALLEWAEVSEYPNGKFDGNIIFGGANGEGGEGGTGEGGTGEGGEGGSQGGDQGGNQNGFGTES